MFKHFIVSVWFLFYFWYFYSSSIAPVPKPVTAAPHAPKDFKLLLTKVNNDDNGFRYLVDANVAWEHIFKDTAYMVHGFLQTIGERTECSHHVKQVNVAAKGFSLYKYLLDNPQFSDTVQSFHEDTVAHQHGDVFYFTCKDRIILKLNMCPSGTFFQNQVCLPFSSCVGKPDYTKLPLHSNIQKFIECKNNREFTGTCPQGTFFYHDRCIQRNQLAYYCKLNDTVVPIKLDEVTLFECRDHKPIYTKCEPGTQFFESTECEPNDCVGQLDGTRLPLQEHTRGPFHYVPGYMECLDEKVARVVECPNDWDASLTKGDDTTLLPMVFHGNECAIPTYCENVFSNNPDTIVPVHEFTKHVKNWHLSESYDLSAGYICSGGSRKRKSVSEDKRISKKRFTVEPACQPGLKLSMDQNRYQYYDCDQQQAISCDPGDIFDGQGCRVEPKNAFKYRGVPIFNFDSLNTESWIETWDYKLLGSSPPLCHSSDYQLSTLYDVCIHTDCKKYPFLSMVPTFRILLPRAEQAQCSFDPSDSHIKKEAVDFDYTFWDQQEVQESRRDTCTFGQRISSGNFIWDSTVYATCDMRQPFIFCPSTHTTKLVRERGVYACEPPPGNIVHHTRLDTSPDPWTSYTTNEFSRILSTVPDVTHFFLNKIDPLQHLNPNASFVIPKDEPFTLKTNQPVDLELRYRVTHPPNVAFVYDSPNPQMKSATLDQGFLVRYENFTRNPVTFPTYTPELHVDSYEM